ncbi:MAG TPA: fibronectin type III domain-containing protein [Geobacteraceae bacterium]
MIKTLALSVAALVLMIVAGCGTGPEAPTNLTVTSTNPITLSWTAPSGATSYNVYRGTTTGGLSFKTLLASNVTVTTYTDTAALPATTYYYQVTAVSSDGMSGASNEVNAVAQQSSGGSFVLGGTVVGSQIVLNWTNVAGAVSYNVYRGAISAIITNKQLIAPGIFTTTYSDSAVAFGATYYYQVTAVNANGIEFQVSSETPVTF